MTVPFAKRINIPIIGITGATRSGKAMISNIISSFNGVEKSSVDVMLEQFYFLYETKNINKTTAVYLIRKNLNLLFYYNFLGRNTNFRKNDFTSVYKYKNPNLYFKRILSKKEGDIIFKKNKNLIPLMLHNGLQSIDLIFEALPSLKIVEMIKNPVELAYSWIKKKYGSDIYDKPRTYVLTLKHKKTVFPYYAKGWEKQYLKMNSYDRVGEIIYRLINKRNKVYNSLTNNNKKKILLLFFDDFVSKPDKNLIKLSKFLNRKKSKFTKKTLIEESCPREIFSKNYENKKVFLKKKLSINIYKKIIYLEKKYLNLIKNEKSTNIQL